MTRHALVSGGASTMVGMSLRRQAFAGVASGALPIVESAGQRPAGEIAISLRVRIVTIRACHRSVEIAVAELVTRLIAETPHAAIHQERALLQEAQLEGKVFLERHSGQKGIIPQGVLAGVTLITGLHRFLLGKAGQRLHPDVGILFPSRPADEFDVSPATSVAGFAVDAQR